MSIRFDRGAWWRGAMALGMLGCSSCHWAQHGAVETAAGGPAGLPQEAWSVPPEAFQAPMPGGPPLPYHVVGPWSPPGLATPWPPEEYLRDGGDKGRPVAVAPDWSVYGLGPEDTVAHYDTLDGRTLVEASNEVHIYAPRFGSVRAVTRLVENEQVSQPLGVMLPAGLARHDEVTIPASSLQRVQARGDLGTQMPGAYRSRQGDGALSSAVRSFAFQDAFLPFEDLAVIRTGAFDQAEKARLAIGIQAAVVWTQDQAVQVLLDHQAASEVSGDQRAEAVFSVEDLRDSPKLRVIKVASTQLAQPGETVDFTLRYDNVGDQPLGNIVLIDNLTTRLEYVEGSAQSSVDAEFSTELNDQQSLVLRWEIAQPLEPGEGGIVRFQCLVR